MEIYLISIFFAGIVSAFLPCTLPIILGYLGYVAGSSDTKGDKVSNRKEVLIRTFWFFIGFSIVFVFFGSLAGLFGLLSSTQIFFSGIREILYRVGGVFVILVGLFMLNAIPLPNFFRRAVSFPMPSWIKDGGPMSSLIIGIIFASGWSPCIGPILAVALGLASTTGSVLGGMFYLFVFSVGVAVPFFAFAFLFGSVLSVLKKVEWLNRGVSIVGGVFFVMLGVLLLTDSISILTSIIKTDSLFYYVL